MYSRAMLAILLLGLFPLAISAEQLAPYQAADGFCSVPGWSVLAWQHQVKVDDWIVHLEDVSVASSYCQNEHPALLSIFDESNQSLGVRGSFSICPMQNLTVMRASDGRSIVLSVGKAAVALSPSAEWIEIFGRAKNCSDEYADIGFSTPVGAASPAIPPLAGVGGSNAVIVGNGSQPGTPPNVIIVTSPLPAPAQPPANAPTEQPAAPTEQPAVTTESTPPAPPQPPVSSPPQPAPSPSAAPPAAYAYDKSAQQLGASPPPIPPAAQASSGNWPWWMGPAIVAVLGAFFMGVMAFYYRSPSVLGPFQAPGVPAPEAEAFPPVYLSTTRIALMEQMADTERIPTDIALRLKKSKSTVVEQLEDLCASGLVERIQTPGKKFVFYRLSRSGRHALVHSPDAKKKPSLLPF